MEVCKKKHILVTNMYYRKRNTVALCKLELWPKRSDSPGGYIFLFTHRQTSNTEVALFMCITSIGNDPDSYIGSRRGSCSELKLLTPSIFTVSKFVIVDTTRMEAGETVIKR